MSGIVNDTLPRRLERLVSNVLRYTAFVLAASALGALVAVVWWLATPLPTFTVSDTGDAYPTQQDLTRMVAAEAWYCLLGLVAGALIGFAAWRLFRNNGWALSLLAVVAALAAASVCWWTGHRLGPADFAERLTSAAAGAAVPTELTLRAKIAVLVWPFAAVLPVLIGSSLGTDPEAPSIGDGRSHRPSRRSGTAGRAEAGEGPPG